MNNKALIGAIGISLTVLLTNEVNNETDYVSFILENKAVMETTEYKRLYENGINKCNEAKLEPESASECRLEAMYNGIREAKKLTQ